MSLGPVPQLARLSPSGVVPRRGAARRLGAPESGGVFVTRDARTLEVLALARQVADTPATVLISGESGTGKELVAELIRDGSGARAEPFVPVNCAAVPESLQESELFGHVKGAFTGASERKIGKLERANGGTLFLDEVGEMSPSLQAALLRTLQSGEYSPVGSSETRFCDVRVIAASNRDLSEMVDKGEFRRDLFYRLNIIRLELPPLRERKGDLPELCRHFCEKLGPGCGKPDARVSRAALERLATYDFPGNVRELENFLRRAMFLCAGPEILPEHLPSEVTASGIAETIAELGDFQAAKAAAVERFERGYLTAVLTKCGGIVSRASAYSGLSERNFHEKLKRYGIDAKSFRGPRAES
jgi:DNA-binding NtrC family response regulator